MARLAGILHHLKFDLYDSMQMKQAIKLALLVLGSFGAGMWVERHVENEKSGSELSGSRLPVSILTPADSRAEIHGEPRMSGEPGPAERRPARGEDDGGGRKRGLIELLALTEEEAMHDALHGYSSDDAVRLFKELRKSGHETPEARNLKRALYQRWAHNDPEGALAEVLNESDVRLKIDVLHTAFAEMAERDLSKATAAFLGLKTHRERQEAVEAMAHHVDVAEMSGLASFLAENASDVEVEGLFHRWAELEPDSAQLETLAAARGPRALQAVARGYAQNDVHKALAWAREIDESFPGTRALLSALESLVDKNPGEAAGWLGELPPGRQQQDAAREIAHRWAREDLDAALAWTETLDGFTQRAARDGLTHEWARQDPRAAAEFAQLLPASEQRRDTLAQIAHLWARDDVNAALDWAHTLPNQESVHALHGVVRTVAEQNPETAADLVSQLGGAVERRAYRELAGNVASEWSEFDPVSAAAWAQSLGSEGKAQQEAIRRVADHWVQQDPMAASQWIGTLPAGSMRDAAAERLVDHVASYDPAAAYQWALTAGSVDHQTAMLEHVFRQWRHLDAQAAQSTLDAAPITAEQRQRLGGVFGENVSP